jgi:hypothetical protein
MEQLASKQKTMAKTQSNKKKHTFKSLKDMIIMPNVGFSLKEDADRAPLSDGRQMPAEEESIPTTMTQNGLEEEHEEDPNQNNVRVYREGVKVTDVVLGRSNEKGIYAKALREWWPHYESATHSGKRVVCRAVIQDLHKKGVRFLNREDNNTRHGYYTVEPHTSVTVERKILRGLREHVKKHEIIMALTAPPQSTASAKFHPFGAKAFRGKKGGTQAEGKKNRPVKRSKASKCQPIHPSAMPIAQEITRKLGDVAYVPILPAPSPEHQFFPSFLIPPPLQTEPTPPILQVASSSGSIGGDHPKASPQLIPSALNWSTSDLKEANGPTSKPYAATSPDTVMLPLSGDEPTATPGPSKPILQMRSSISYDLTKIFDDVIDPVTGEIATNTQNKECPPLLSGRQSSMFSMVHFTDWQHEMGHESHPLKNVIKPSSSTMNRRLSLIDDDLPPSNTAVASYIGLDPPDDPMVPSTPRINDHFDRNSFFGADETAALISPALVPPKNFGTPKSPMKDFAMPGITPDEDRYHRHYSSMDSTDDRSNEHHPIPMKQAAAHRTISDHENEEYRALCRRLEVSMARLESEELEHRSWEAHNEALWRHFIQEQPDLAKLLNSRNREDTKVSAKGASNTQWPEGRFSLGAGNPDNLGEEIHNMESWKWSTHSFGDEMEDAWTSI